MGSSKTIAQVVGICSMVFGIAISAIASLFFNDYVDLNTEHHHCSIYEVLKPFCEARDFYLAAAILGVCAGIIQVASYILIWKKKYGMFVGSSVIVFILCVAAITIVIAKKALDLHVIEGASFGNQFADYEIHADLYVALLVIDLVFSFVTGVIMFMLSRKS